ncbi:MAG: transcription antitermination factor NusB [Actinomycetota bacterium]
MSLEIPGLSRRREAREDALAVLYQAEVAGDSVEAALAAREVPPDAYAIEIADGVDEARDDLDALIGRHLKNWRIERMPIVDRLIARMAAWELETQPETPTGVVLSEAVELASQYCGEKSPQFLNGVLSSVADEVRG